jgi:MFS family permease
MRLNRPEWLTFTVLVAMAGSFFNTSQSHFLQGPFSKLMQNQNLEQEIPRLNAITTGASIVGSLVVMFWVNQRNVKPLTMAAYIASTVFPFLYIYVFSVDSVGTLTVVRTFQIFVGLVGFGGVSLILRLVFPEDSTNHQKASALDTTFWAIAAMLANLTGFVFIDSLFWWASIGCILNVMACLSVAKVKLPSGQLEEKKKQAVPRKEWARLSPRIFPGLAADIVFSLVTGYAPLFIKQNWLAGICMTLFILFIQVGAWISPVTSKKWSEKKTMSVGQIVMVGGLLLAWANSMISPYGVLLGAVVMGVSYGAHRNAHGFLVNNSTHYKGAAVGMDKLSFTTSGLAAAGFAGWVGMGQVLWLMGIPLIVLGFLVLPFIHFPSASKRLDVES